MYRSPPEAESSLWMQSRSAEMEADPPTAEVGLHLRASIFIGLGEPKAHEGLPRRDSMSSVEVLSLESSDRRS